MFQGFKASRRHRLQHTSKTHFALRSPLQVLLPPCLAGFCGPARVSEPTSPRCFLCPLTGGVLPLLPPLFLCPCPTWASSSACWRRLYQRRLLCVVVLALNCIHDGFRRPPLHLLWRLPNAHQRQAYQRMLKLIQACDRPGDFPFPPAAPVANSLPGCLSSRALPLKLTLDLGAPTLPVSRLCRCY